jgi:hypothetical protein
MFRSREFDIDCHFELKGGDRRGPVTIYAPGDRVSGSVRLAPQADIPCRSVTLQLEWHTEGKGDRDQQIIHEKTLHQGNLRMGSLVGDNFVFQLPEGPVSYAGQLINIIWTITIKVDVPRAKDATFQEPFIVARG